MQADSIESITADYSRYSETELCESLLVYETLCSPLHISANEDSLSRQP